jgi:hypothetical protein
MGGFAADVAAHEQAVAGVSVHLARWGAYRLKASNAAPPILTFAGAIS